MTVEVIDVECLSCTLGCVLLGRCSLTANKRIVKKSKQKKLKKTNEK
jgi:hypothetical protein